MAWCLSVHIFLTEWIMNLYSALLCIIVHPKHFTITWGVSPQSPPVSSIHLDDATAATEQQRQCAHHTPATGGEERVIEPIKWMGIIRRPWLTRASGGNLARTPGLHPYSLPEVTWIFNYHRESGPRFWPHIACVPWSLHCGGALGWAAHRPAADLLLQWDTEAPSLSPDSPPLPPPSECDHGYSTSPDYNDSEQTEMDKMGAKLWGFLTGLTSVKKWCSC